MKPSCLRLSVSLSLLLLLPLATRRAESQSAEWGPVQEYLYLGSRLLLISPPNGPAGPPFITNAQETIVVSEKAGRVLVPIRLYTTNGEPTTVEVSVKYSTASGSARAGSDFRSTSGVLAFPPQSPSGTKLEIEVPILDDAVSEPDKAFTIVLSDPKGAEVLSPTSRPILITDDDRLPAASGGEPL